jgi:hypothetical protein
MKNTTKHPTQSALCPIAEGGANPDWRKEWKDMPEFVQEKQHKEYSKIILRFRNEQDLKDFSTLIKQNINKKTKSIWYPQLIRGLNSHLRYSDEP